MHDKETFARANELRNEVADTSLGQFTVSDLPALVGLMRLVDGAGSVFHPSAEDVEVVERRLHQK